MEAIWRKVPGISERDALLVGGVTMGIVRQTLGGFYAHLYSYTTEGRECRVRFFSEQEVARLYVEAVVALEG